MLPALHPHPIAPPWHTFNSCPRAQTAILARQRVFVDFGLNALCDKPFTTCPLHSYQLREVPKVILKSVTH